MLGSFCFMIFKSISSVVYNEGTKLINSHFNGLKDNFGHKKFEFM